MERKKLHEDAEPEPRKTWDWAPSHSTLNLYHAIQDLKEPQISMVLKSLEKIRMDLSEETERKELEMNKQELAQNFINANKVIKDNKASSFRFNEIIRENTNEIELLKEQREHVKEDIEHYTKIKNEMEPYVNEYSQRYEVFLQRVTQDAPEFNSIQDILNRSESLENCRNDCSDLLTAELEESSEMRSEMMWMMEEKSTILKKLDNWLVMLQILSKQANEHRRHWERLLQRLKSMTATRHEESETLCNACHDFYLQVCRQRRVAPTLDNKDMEGQLQFIQESILFFKEVIRIATTVRQERHNSLKESRTANLLKCQGKKHTKLQTTKVQNKRSSI